MTLGYNNTGGTFGEDQAGGTNRSEYSNIKRDADSGAYLKYFIYQETSITNAPINTQYTISVYARAFSSTYVGDTFKFIFHDDAQAGQAGRWTGATDTGRYDDAQKSPDQILTEKWKRYSYTFTTESSANLTGRIRAGIVPSYSDNNGMYVWGAQLEQNSQASVYVYTWSNDYTPTDTVTASHDPRLSSLGPGANASYTATYTITQAVMDISEELHNSVKFIGNYRTPSGLTATTSDVSDDNDDTDGNLVDDATVVPLNNISRIEATKTVTATDTNGDGFIGLGDTVSYTVLIQNTGNLTLNAVSVSDTLTDASSNSLTISGPTFVSADQGSIAGTLKVSETATYSASYTLEQSAVDSGKVINYVVATGSSTVAVVTDTSDDGDDTDSNTVSDVTELIITASPTLEVTKTASVTDVNGNGSTGEGDLITYTITIENKGNVSLSGLTVTDTILDGDGASLALTTTPTFVSASGGSTSSTLIPSGVSTFTATYSISNQSANTPLVSNSAVAIASSPGQSNNVSDTSDDPTTATPNDTTNVTMAAIPGIEATKTASVTDVNGNGVNDLNDIITYTITIENTGNVTLTSVTLSDTLKDSNGNIYTYDVSPTLVSATPGSNATTLSESGVATFTVSYTIGSPELLASKLINSLVAKASSPGQSNNVTDTSDDGDDTDGDTVSDTTDVDLTADAKLEVVKTVAHNDVDGDGKITAGDILTYTIVVSNTGNVTLQPVYLEDTMSDLQGNARSLNASPTWISNSQGSIFRKLLAGEAANYTASYTVVSADEVALGVKNQAFAKAYWYPPPGNVLTLRASDTSDDGDDTDGNLVDDPTISYTSIDPSIEVTKTASATDTNGNGVLYDAGDLITFTIVVANTSSDVINDLNYEDTFTSGQGRALTFTTTPTFVSGTSGSTSKTLTVGGTSTFRATYSVTSPTILSGGVYNTITFTGSSARNPNPSQRDVIDVSDDGDDTDGNTTNDITFFLLGIDTDNDGIPNKIDIDDDNDGIMDKDEACLNYLLDGNSFENYWKAGAPINPCENKVSAFPNSTVVYPWSAVNGDGDVWDAAFFNGTQWDPQQGTYFIELTQARAANTGAYWDEKIGQDPSWTPTDIATSAAGANDVFAADMDGDGDLDIISSSRDDDTIAWYENNGAADPTWTATDIATNADLPREVFAADMDGDGDMDIIAGSFDNDQLVWYENNGAANPTWSRAFIYT